MQVIAKYHTCIPQVLYIITKPTLTHYQMTNFRLFQTERVCRRQFQIWRNWQKFIQTGRKHWEKEKLFITSNFSFSYSVFKGLVSQGHQKVSLCKNGLNGMHEINSKPNDVILDIFNLTAFAGDHDYLNKAMKFFSEKDRKHYGKRRNSQ